MSFPGHKTGSVTPTTHTSSDRPANKGKKYPPNILSAHEVLSILDHCRTDALGRRLRAMIGLLYRTGADPSELLAARTRDVDLTPDAARILISRPLRLQGRTLGLDQWAADLTGTWLEHRSGFPGDALFCVMEGPNVGESWSLTDMRVGLRNASRAALGRSVSPRDFRHTLLAELIIEQWPLPYIQTQLGLTDVHSFKKIFPRLGIIGADDAEVASIARMRPPWFDDADGF